MDNLAPGWLTKAEINLVLKCMKTQLGSILEIGSCAGRLFSGLHQTMPDWTYTGLDKWDGGVPILLNPDNDSDDIKNWDKRYVDVNGNCDTLSIFKKYCPYATTIQADFFDYDFGDTKFDVISVGAISRKWNLDDWHKLYIKIHRLVVPGGYVIGRNNNSNKPWGEFVRSATYSYVRNLKDIHDIHISDPTSNCCWMCADGSFSYCVNDLVLSDDNEYERYH